MKTALYRHFDQAGRLLYVGISLCAVTRLGQHGHVSRWVGEITAVTIEHFEDRKQAVEAEREAIIAESPLWNKTHRSPRPVPRVRAMPKGCDSERYMPPTLLEKQMFLYVLDHGLDGKSTPIRARDLDFGDGTFTGMLRILNKLFRRIPFYLDGFTSRSADQVVLAIYLNPAMVLLADTIRDEVRDAIEERDALKIVRRSNRTTRIRYPF